MTYQSLIPQLRAAQEMLSRLLEQNRAYAEAFGYPSGRICPHCGKEAFGNPEHLDALAGAPPNAGVAHDYCLEIASLKERLAKLLADPPRITLVQMPNPSAQEGENASEAASPPAQNQEPAPNQSQEGKEESRASA